MIVTLAPAGLIHAQTPTTGALTGVTLDPSGAVVDVVTVRLVRLDGPEVKITAADENGWFSFLLLPPGVYQLQANKSDFEAYSLTDLRVHVTETLRLEVHLRLAARAETTQASEMPTQGSPGLRIAMQQ